MSRDPPAPKASESAGERARLALQSTKDAREEATRTEGPDDATPASGTTSLAHTHLTIAPKQYEVKGEYARGGLGRILVATDTQLQRPVALKLLLRASRADQRRFIREALITARLQHPAIVPIYDAGRWPDGEPFYAMRLVAGQPLSKRIRATKTLADRLALLPNVIVVAEAMAYAHSRGFIHRDLKPENVLIGEFGETVVIDWGLAKFIGRDLVHASRKPDDAHAGDDAGADGADGPDGEGEGEGEPELAELALPETEIEGTLPGKIMGTPAYMPPEQARGDVVDARADVYAIGALLYQLLSGKAPYASSGLRAMELLVHAASNAPEALEEIEPTVPRDLLAIVTKAMARDPGDRYPTAREIAEDLKRFQTGQLVAARRYSRWQLAQRWLRRHSAAVAFITVALAVLAAVAGVSVRRILAERDRADRERAQAETARGDAIARADDLTLLQARTALARDPTAAVASLKSLSPAWTQWGEVRGVALDAKLRGVASSVFFPGASVWGVAYSPDGKMLASAGAERSLRVVDLATGAARVLSGHEGDVVAVAFSPDGSELASGSLDGTVRLWTLATGASRTVVTHERMALAVAYSPDGASLATGGYDGLKIWRRDGLLQTVPRGESSVRASVIGVAYSPDGAKIAYSGEDSRVFVRDVATGATRVLVDPTSQVIPSVAFSSDGTKLVTSSDAPLVRVWDLATGESTALRGHESKTDSAAFSRDGRFVISAGQDKTVRVWDLAWGTSRARIGHDVVTSVAVSPDGVHFASGSGDRTVRVWSFDDGVETLAQTTFSRALAFSADGTRFATAANDDVLVFDLVHRTRMTLHGHEGRIITVAFDRAGSRLASAGADRTVRVWRLADGAKVATFAHPLTVYGAAFSADGERLITACEDLLVREYRLDAPEEAPRLARGHRGPVYALALSPGGTRLATASWDQTVRIWDTATWTSLRELTGHGDWVIAVGFSPNGSQVVSGGNDRTIRIWDVATGAGRVLGMHESWVSSTFFSPDGTRVLSAGFDHRVRAWDVTSGREVWTRTLESVAHMAVFSPDGTRVASTSEDNVVSLWSPAMPEGASIRDWVTHATNAVMSPKGELTESR